jgi:hypothetical protein
LKALLHFNLPTSPFQRDLKLLLAALALSGMGHGDHHHGGHNDEAPIYTRPYQRQKWGEAQILPHSDFGNTFFDLFYVAGYVETVNLIEWYGMS